jgi:hypothetical protein
MRRQWRRWFAIGPVAALAAFIACGDDELGTVRARPDGGDAAADADAGPQELLACGVPVPSTYTSPNLAANAKEELDLKARFEELEAKMRAAEGANVSVVTAAELRAIYEAGTPSLKSISTPAAQALVESYFTAFGDANQKTWTPDLPESEAGAPTGGKYENGYYFSASGVDLREATEKTLLGGAWFNHALVVASGPKTEATIDRLLVSFGASPALANRTDADAGDEADELIAEYASKRDDKSQTKPGPYRKIARALIRAKTAAAAGDKCADDLSASLSIYFAEWERVTYATAIYYLNSAAANALAQPPKGPAALHAFGEALGLVQSFKGLAQDRRRITDLQIDDVLSKIGAATPYQLVTKSADRVPKLVEGINAIAVVYGFTPDEVESFKKAF